MSDRRAQEHERIKRDLKEVQQRCRELLSIEGESTNGSVDGSAEDGDERRKILNNLNWAIIIAQFGRMHLHSDDLYGALRYCFDAWRAYSIAVVQGVRPYANVGGKRYEQLLKFSEYANEAAQAARELEWQRWKNEAAQIQAQSRRSMSKRELAEKVQSRLNLPDSIETIRKRI